MRVNRAIEDGSFFENPALVGAFERARERGGDVHLLGLVSYGGVHSHIDHLRALLELARREGMAERTWIHAFTDGRDVSPHAAVARPRRAAAPSGSRRSSAATTRWTATSAGSGRDRALDAIVDGEGDARATIPSRHVRASYERGRHRRVHRAGRRSTGARGSARDDAAIFFNFRPDRGAPAGAAAARGAAST